MPKAAPGSISVTADSWTVNTTKGAFLGITAHWIEVNEGKWKMCLEVIGFQPVLGDHSGENLARYFVGVCDRVGIMGKEVSKVSHMDSFVVCSLSDYLQILITAAHGHP